jgi:putative aldouronate transport system permease protein
MMQTKSAVVKKKKGFLRELAVNKWLYGMLAPGLLYFAVFNYLPLAGLYFAFVNYNFMKGPYGFGSEFVGLSNFEFFFTSDQWLPITFNTLYLNFAFLITGLAAQILLAMAINELGGKVFKKVAQSLMFLPNFLSWTVVAIFSLALFGSEGGFVNNALMALGMEPVDFYLTPKIWPGMLILFRLWKGAGFGTVIFLATITGINQEIFEAARIDGANRIKTAWYITLPMLKPTAIMLLIMSMGTIFNGDFSMIYALVGDNTLLRETTDVIDTYVFRALRVNNDIGMSSAVGLFQSAIGFIMVVTVNAIARRVDRDTALF